MDSLRLSVVEVIDHSRTDGDGFEVQIHVNGEEITSRGAGMGMDPWDLLVPACPLQILGSEPRQVPVARCGCGNYGCAMTDVVITTDGDRVHWDWRHAQPLDRPVTFDRAAYDAELARARSDRTWETPLRRAGRFTLERLPGAHLARFELTIDWVGGQPPPDGRLTLCLRAVNHQILVSVPWRRQTPDAAANELVQQLRRPPDEWTAEWLHLAATNGRPPPLAGPGWRPLSF